MEDKHMNGSFSLPVYGGRDGTFNRRCTKCHERIFPEEERYLIAQALLFHVTCFRCSICTTCCDIIDYCYVAEHDNFYCLRHYHEMVEAGKGIRGEGRAVNGTGPGAFAGKLICMPMYHDSYVNLWIQSSHRRVRSFLLILIPLLSIFLAVVGRQRKRKDILKILTEYQKRRTKLAQISFKLEEAVKISKGKRYVRKNMALSFYFGPFARQIYACFPAYVAKR